MAHKSLKQHFRKPENFIEIDGGKFTFKVVSAMDALALTGSPFIQYAKEGKKIPENTVDIANDPNKEEIYEHQKQTEALIVKEFVTHFNDDPISIDDEDLEILGERNIQLIANAIIGQNPKEIQRTRRFLESSSKSS